MDIYDKGYTGHLFLYIFCGLLDAMWQTTAYWMMGAMSNDPAKLAYFTGVCEHSVPLLSGARTNITCYQTSQYSRPGPLVFGGQML